MTNQHPITPPPELVQQWEEQWSNMPGERGSFVHSYMTTQSARWGADQELEACLDWLEQNDGRWEIRVSLRDARRPKPPSLKEQALKALTAINSSFHVYEPDASIIRRAIEQLPDAL